MIFFGSGGGHGKVDAGFAWWVCLKRKKKGKLGGGEENEGQRDLRGCVGHGHNITKRDVEEMEAALRLGENDSRGVETGDSC